MHFCKTQILLVLPLPRSHPCLPTSSGLLKHEDIFICSSMDAQSWGRAGRAGRRQPGSRAQVEQRAPLGQVGSRGWQAAAAMGAEAPSLRSYFRFSFLKLPGSKRKLQGWGNNEKGSLFSPQSELLPHQTLETRTAKRLFPFYSLFMGIYLKGTALFRCVPARVSELCLPWLWGCLDWVLWSACVKHHGNPCPKSSVFLGCLLSA